MKLTNLLSATRILEEKHSKYNGDIKVIRDLAWGTYIKAGRLTQSGGVVANIWKEVLKKILETKPQINNSLIIGLGGGTVSNLISQYWVGSKITGVDIDPIIVDLGTKYLNLDRKEVKVVVMDAMKFVLEEKGKYDLIIVDLYRGDEFPKKFEDKKFLVDVKKLLRKDGVALFNRLYGGQMRPNAMRFGDKLEKVFKKVEYIYPQANVVMICYN